MIIVGSGSKPKIVSNDELLGADIFMRTSKKKAIRARHEAGHAVMAYLTGRTVISLELGLTHEGGPWIPAGHRILISTAGYAAESVSCLPFYVAEGPSCFPVESPDGENALRYAAEIDRRATHRVVEAAFQELRRFFEQPRVADTVGLVAHELEYRTRLDGPQAMGLLSILGPVDLPNVFY